MREIAEKKGDRSAINNRYTSCAAIEVPRLFRLEECCNSCDDTGVDFGCFMPATATSFSFENTDGARPFGDCFFAFAVAAFGLANLES